MAAFPNMSAELRAKWLAALRSGEYKQTQGSLRETLGRMRFDEDEPAEIGYCCLGVLIDVAGAEWVAEWENGPTNFLPKLPGVTFDECTDSAAMPSTDIAAALGLIDVPEGARISAGLVFDAEGLIVSVPKNLMTALAELNDEFNFDFETIAAVIETDTIAAVFDALVQARNEDEERFDYEEAE